MSVSGSEHRLLVLSDLHVDHWESAYPDKEPIRRVISMLPEDFIRPDLLVSAGDLVHVSPLGWEYGIGVLRESLPDDTPLLLVPGNHDYYLGELNDDPLREVCGRMGVGFGQKSESHLGATRILTCTLWSDGLLFGEDRRPEVLRAVQNGLGDYRHIRKLGLPTLITALDTVSLHEDHLSWLGSRLAVKHDGPTVVITHHGPHPEASLPIDVITSGFVSDLSGFIEEHQPDAWVFGHTHRPQSAVLGKTRIHNVGLGYPHEAAGYGIREIMLRGCLTVGDEVRFLMDEEDPRPVRVIGPNPVTRTDQPEA